MLRKSIRCYGAGEWQCGILLHNQRSLILFSFRQNEELLLSGTLEFIPQEGIVGLKVTTNNLTKLSNLNIPDEWKNFAVDVVYEIFYEMKNEKNQITFYPVTDLGKFNKTRTLIFQKQ